MWGLGSDRKVIYNSSVPEAVIVDMIEFKNQFIQGIDNFFVYCYSHPDIKRLVEPRLQHLIQVYEIRNNLELHPEH